MKIVHPSFEIISNLDGKEALKQIEKVARTCYKSEHLITDESAEKMVKRLVDSKHEAMLEFYDITVKFTCDRAIANEIVRHRVASYAQESTRYCNYGKDKFDNELTFIIPQWCCLAEGVYDKIGDTWCANGVPQYALQHNERTDVMLWLDALQHAENTYLGLCKEGWTAEKARMVLPMSTKTEINMKANLREWRHFFKLRCHSTAHPDVRYLAKQLLMYFTSKIPVVFDDLYKEFIEHINPYTEYYLTPQVYETVEPKDEYLDTEEINGEDNYLLNLLGQEPIAPVDTLIEIFENDKSLNDEQERTNSITE